MQVWTDWEGLEPKPERLDRLVLLGAPGDTALVDRDGMLNFAELDGAVGSLSAHLAGQSCLGARVASWLPKTRLSCLLPLACARAGLIHVPINPLLKRAQVAHIVADSQATLLITQSARAALLDFADVDGSCRILSDAEFADPHPSPLPASVGDTHALAALLYTSGSTGMPKGVMLSHANLWLGAISVAHYLRLTRRDRTLAILPLSFDAGLNQLLSTWAAGGCVVPLDYLVAQDVVRAIERHSITTLAGVPALWSQLADVVWTPQATACLQQISATGGRMPAGLVRSMRTRFPQASLYLMYGFTEAFRSTYLEPKLVDTHPASIGKPIPFAEILVVRADGSIAAPGEPGELVHTGSLVAQGYWRDPERSAQTFKPAPPGAALEGLAAWSGDTVVRGHDDLLSFVGRNDEMIKVSGVRISPTEIEHAAIESGLVRDACALGVHDERLGQTIRLVVSGNGNDQALRAHLKAVLPSFQQPRDIAWVRTMPYTPNGKLDRRAVVRDHSA